MNNKNNIHDFKLSDIKKENPFKVPANYFEELPTQVQNKIANTPKQETIFDKLMFIFSPKFGVVFAGVLVIAMLAINFTKTEQTDYLSNLDVDYYTIIETIDFDEDELLLADLYQPTEINADDISIDVLLEQEIEDYELY